MSSANLSFFQLMVATPFKQVSIVLWKIGPINSTYGVPPQGHFQSHVQGQTCNNQCTHFFTLKREHMHVFLHNICRICMQSLILFNGIHFVLSYSTQRLNAYVAGNLFKIKKREKWSMSIAKTKHVQLFWNGYQEVAFHDLKEAVKKKIIISCIFW